MFRLRARLLALCLIKLSIFLAEGAVFRIRFLRLVFFFAFLLPSDPVNDGIIMKVILAEDLFAFLVVALTRE